MLVAKAVPRCFILQLSYRPSPGAVGCQFTASIALGPVKTGRSFYPPIYPLCLDVSRLPLAGLRPVLSTWVPFPPIRLTFHTPLFDNCAATHLRGHRLDELEARHLRKSA